MTARKGALVLIKIENGQTTGQYDTIGGLRTSSMLLGSQLLDSSNLDSGQWQELMSGGGLQSLSIIGSGLFTGSAAEEILRAAAFSGEAKNYRFYFASGDCVAGAFRISSYERAGDHDGAELFRVTLHSSGPIDYINTGA